MDSLDMSVEQICWERIALERAEVVLFWFAKETVAPIALFELGCWSNTAKRLVVGVEPGYPREFDIYQQMALVRPELPVYRDLSLVIDAVVEQSPRFS